MNKIPRIEELVANLDKEQQRVEGYAIHRKIGNGAYAYVLEASKDRFGNIRRALKLPAHDEAIKDIRARQIVLSALGNTLYSTHLVDEGSFEGFPYIVEEFREKSLADIIAERHKEGNRPSVEEIVELGESLLEGIDYFHRLSETNPAAAKTLGVECLTHCDIKPSNILQVSDGSFEYTDFGVRIEDMSEIPGKMSIINSADWQSIKSRDKSGNVTRNMYASPEVRTALIYQDRELPATVRSDLWSIGAILFHYAVGRAPNWGEADPKEVRTDLPERLSGFFRKILNGSPERRHQNARVALNELERFCEFAPDSFIIGLMRTKEGYAVFKQNMHKGNPVEEALRFDFESVDSPVPQVFYIPPMKSTLVHFVDTKERWKLHLCLLDRDLEINKSDATYCADSFGRALRTNSFNSYRWRSGNE